MKNTPWLSSFMNERLDLIVLITEQCNFRCVYCYEDFKLGKISDDVIEGIKNLVTGRIGQIRILNLSFFGGEPLMNKPALLELSGWAGALCRAHRVAYAGHITTNGYSLDGKTFGDLIRCGVTNFQITLDGDRNGHDGLRPALNGKPTFDRIYSNMKAMAGTGHDFNCTIRLNVADSNVPSVGSFVNDYSGPFSRDARFRIHFHPIFGMQHLKLTKEAAIKGFMETARQKGFRFEDPEEDNLCYAARADSFVIRADGRVQKCTVALESEINQLGNISRDGALNIDQEKFKKWVFAENKECPVQSLALENLVVSYENAGKHADRATIV